MGYTIKTRFDIPLNYSNYSGILNRPNTNTIGIVPSSV